MSNQGDSVEDDEGGVDEAIASEGNISDGSSQTKKRQENGGLEEKDDGREQNEEEEQDEEEEEEEEEEEKPPDVPLTAEMIVDCLSLLCKTGDGMAHAYVKLDAAGRALTDIMLLSSYIHVRYVDISKNHIRDLTPLNCMTQMLTLNADFNLLPMVGLQELPYLQRATFTNNQIQSLSGMSHPLLEYLNLNFNKVPSFVGLDSEKLSHLQTLELRGNGLQSLAGINLPNLKNLYLAANNINSLEGLDQLENLQLLHLRANELVKLNGFSANNVRLQYVNLRGNNIAKLSEVRKMQCLPALQVLVLMDNPIMELESYRMDVLVALQTLTRLDKDIFTDEEKEDASVMRKEREAENKDDDEDEKDQEDEEEEEEELIDNEEEEVIQVKEPSNQSIKTGKAAGGDEFSTASDIESTGDDDSNDGDDDGDDN